MACARDNCSRAFSSGVFPSWSRRFSVRKASSCFWTSTKDPWQVPSPTVSFGFGPLSCAFAPGGLARRSHLELLQLLHDVFGNESFRLQRGHRASSPPPQVPSRKMNGTRQVEPSVWNLHKVSMKICLGYESRKRSDEEMDPRETDKTAPMQMLWEHVKWIETMTSGWISRCALRANGASCYPPWSACELTKWNKARSMVSKRTPQASSVNVKWRTVRRWSVWEEASLNEGIYPQCDWSLAESFLQERGFASIRQVVTRTNTLTKGGLHNSLSLIRKDSCFWRRIASMSILSPPWRWRRCETSA